MNTHDTAEQSDEQSDEQSSEQPSEQPTTPPPEQLDEQSAPARPLLTLTEAAKACGISRASIRRKLDAQEFPNAVRDDDEMGTWRVPVTDLLAAGLAVNRYDSPTEQSPSPTEQHEATGQTVTEQATVHAFAAAELQRAVEIARLQGEVKRWQAIADERARALERADRAMAMLGVGERAEEQERPAPPRRRRWWARN